MIKIHKIATTLLIGALMLTNSSSIVNAASTNTNYTSNSEWYKETKEYKEFVKGKDYKHIGKKDLYFKVDENINIDNEKSIKINPISKDEYVKQNKKIEEVKKDISLGKNTVLERASYKQYGSYMRWSVDANKYGDRYDITASYEWLRFPGEPRVGQVGNDVFGISLGNYLDIIPGTERFAWYNDKWYNGQLHTDTGNIAVNTEPGGIYVNTRMKDRIYNGLDTYGSNERGLLVCSTKKNISGALSTNIASYYSMAVTGYSGSINVSIPKSGSMSVSPTEKYTNLTDNPLIRVTL